MGRVMSRRWILGTGSAALIVPALPIFEAAARARYWPDPGNAASEAYLSDLAREVAVNSRIVARKFRLFNLGARIVCCALAILLAPAIWHVTGWIAR